MKTRALASLLHIAYKKREPGDSDSLYLKLIRTLCSSKNSSHNINVYFDEDMKVRELKMVDKDGNMRVVRRRMNLTTTLLVHHTTFYFMQLRSMQIFTSYIISCLTGL